MRFYELFGLIAQSAKDRKTSPDLTNYVDHQNLLGMYRIWHGLRTPNEAFFHRNPELLCLGRQFGQINFGAFGVFSNGCLFLTEEA